MKGKILGFQGLVRKVYQTRRFQGPLVSFQRLQKF